MVGAQHFAGREISKVGDFKKLVNNVQFKLRNFWDIAVLKKMRYALCPMPYALCPMPYAHEYLI